MEEESDSIVVARSGVLRCGVCDRVVNFGDNYCAECGYYLDFKNLLN